MNRWLALGLLLLATGALALRLPRLAQRPFHTDESVHALKFLGLWERGVYRYDPHEYHGPILYYLTLPFVRLSGARSAAEVTEATLRLAPVAFGVGLVVLVGLLADGLGRRACGAAALLTAVSPAMVFYSRYYIHEMLLVFFTCLVLGAGWRYWRTRRLGWALLAGAGLGLMQTTKETFVFAVAAMAGAGVLTVAWRRWVERASPEGCDGVGPDPGAAGLRVHFRAGALALGAALVVSVLLFSSFLTNASGPLDSLRTYQTWLGRAGGDSPHRHPWSFYLERLGWFHAAKGPVWSEGLILGLAVVGLGWALWPRRRPTGPSGSLAASPEGPPEPGQAPTARRAVAGPGGPGVCLALARFIAFYTVLLTAVYCGLAYKTPWCALGFLHGLILLAGIGAAVLLAWPRGRGARGLIGTVLLLAVAQLGWQAWRTAGPYGADRRNPYVYAHTSPDLLRLVNQVEAMAKCDPAGRRMLLKVMAPGGDYWPLPWYLRAFAQAGWWGEVPADPYAPIMVVGAKFDAALDEKSEKKWLMVGLFELRPRAFFELYVRLDLWKRYLEARPKSPEAD